MYYTPIDYDASTTFSRLDYTIEGVSRDHAQVYKTAGYPQLGHVQYTAFNIAELLDINVNDVTQNELIWVANKSNNDWDVFRLTNQSYKIENLRKINGDTQLEITFTKSHGLSAGTRTSQADYFAITNAKTSDLNGVYQVASVTDHKTISIAKTLRTVLPGLTTDGFSSINSKNSIGNSK